MFVCAYIQYGVTIPRTLVSWNTDLSVHLPRSPARHTGFLLSCPGAILDEKRNDLAVLPGGCGVECSAAVCVGRIDIDAKRHRELYGLERQRVERLAIELDPRPPSTHSGG